MTQLIFKIIIIGIMTLDVLVAFFKHGQPRKHVHFDCTTTLAANILMLILFALAGFFK